MPKTNLWIIRSVRRVELDQRSREARLRFERIERVFVTARRGSRFLAQAARLSLSRRQIQQRKARESD
jgi:hypothetical protein